MGQWLSIVAMLASSAGKVTPTVAPRTALVQPQAGGTVTMYATPATISFASTDPDQGLVSGSSASTLYWFYNGTKGKTWSVSAQSGASSFSGCSTVPVSAVTATCSSIQVNGASQPCGGAVALSTAPQVIASGTEAAGFVYYQVTLTFTLTDSWKYIAKTSPACSLTLTYNGTFN
jgi:hypothetical protein